MIDTNIINDNLIERLIRKNMSFNNLSRITQIHGGFVKHTYKVILDNTPYIFQIWKEPDTKLTTSDEDKQDSFYDNNLNNLLSALTIFDQLEIKIPKILFFSTKKDDFPYDYALFEYISGGDLFQNQNKFYDPIFLHYLGNKMSKINTLTRSKRGLIYEPDIKMPPYDHMTSESVRNLNVCLECEVINEQMLEAIIEKLKSLKNKIKPRNKYNLILPDFKPDHILFNEKVEMVMIDCEDIQYFDIEYQLAKIMIPTQHFCNCDAFYSSYFENKFEIDYTRLAFYQLIDCIDCLAFAAESLLKSIATTEEEKKRYLWLAEDGKKVISHFAKKDIFSPILNDFFLKYAKK